MTMDTIEMRNIVKRKLARYFLIIYRSIFLMLPKLGYFVYPWAVYKAQARKDESESGARPTVQGAGFKVQGLRFTLKGSVHGSRCKVQGARCTVQGARCRVQGSRFTV